MAQHDIELILLRQLASYLAMPIFVVDPEGALIYYNEPAEQLLGKRFVDTGAMPAEEWGSIFHPKAADGSPLAVGDLPLVIAVQEGRPAHRRISIEGLDDVERLIDITAFPLVGHAGRQLGAVATFWEVPTP